MVKDRLLELQEKGNNAETEKKKEKEESPKKKKGKSENDKLQDVLREIEKLDERVNKLKENVTKMQKIQRDLYSSVEYDKSQVKEMSKLSEQIFSDSFQIRKEVDQIKAKHTEKDEAGEGSTYNRVVLSQVGRVSTDLTRTYNEFQAAQAEHIDKTKQRYERVQEIVHDDKEPLQDEGAGPADLGEVQTMFAFNPMEEILQAQMELRGIEERDKDIKKLESGVQDINELFKQVNMLVMEQGETIDTIENHVEKAVQDVESGNVQLKQAKESKKKWTKRKFCCIGVVVVLVLIIAGVIALVIVNNQSG